MLPLIFLNVVGGLLFEAYGAQKGWAWSETLVSAVTLSHFAYYFWNPPTTSNFKITRVTLAACILLATLGEYILSPVLGLYHYRASVLPAFVPPGHVLIFLSGLVLSSHKNYRSWITLFIPLAALIPLAYAMVHGFDFLSLPLYLIFLACMFFGPNPSLYSVMFALALGLELVGTSLGSWKWTPIIPGTDYQSSNPPLAAGVFYALLDLLTVWIASRRNKKLEEVGQKTFSSPTPV